jgi:prevent-host-death family protein
LKQTRAYRSAFPKDNGRATTDHLIGQGLQMKSVSLADAKAHLSQLVDEAAAGEPVCITRRGKPIAQIIAVDTPRKRIDVTGLRAMTDAMPVQPETARDFIRRIRDEDRY